MHPRLETIRARIAADFPTDLGEVEIIADPDLGWSLFYAGQVYGDIDHDDVEQRIALAANYLQDVVMDQTGRTWPEAGGQPLFAEYRDGRAWWTRRGHRFAHVGHLNEVLHRYNAA